MRVDYTLQDTIGDEGILIIDRFCNYASEKFTDHVAFLKLNPVTDFRNSDLSYVSFDGCDLRGYDFTGADLTGASGRGVVWDNTTIFKNASVLESIFAYHVASATLFGEDLDLSLRLQRLKREYWTKVVTIVADSLQIGSPDHLDSINIAKQLIEEIDDSSVKTNLLFFLAQVFNSSTDHRDFVIHLLNRHHADSRLCFAATRVLSQLFSSDRVGFELLKRIAFDSLELPDTRNVAVQGVLKSIYFADAIEEISALIDLFDAVSRKLYLRRIASNFGQGYLDVVTNSEGHTIDFSLPITARVIEETARKVLAQRSMNSYMVADAPSSFKVKASEIIAFEPVIEQRLRFLRDNGVPFVFQGATAGPRSKFSNGR